MDILLLNGPSSAGKSSISRCLKNKIDSSVKCRIIALDDYLITSTDEPIWEDDVFEVAPQMCKDIRAALSDGCFVIVDHVITSKRIHDAIIGSFEGFQFRTILVTCDEEVLKKRENERGDRYIGSSEASLEYLYPKDGYDIVVDSTMKSSEMIPDPEDIEDAAECLINDIPYAGFLT